MSTKSKLIWVAIAAAFVVLAVWYFKAQPQYVNVDSPRPVKGDKASSIILEEFSDFQCPACGAAQSTVNKIMETYGDKIAFSYRHFPLLSIHANAFSAALAAECANDQGKFWEYHDLLFKNQKDLRQSTLLRLADETGLNKESFSVCLKSRAKAGVVQADMQEGERRNINSTPTFYLNGQLVGNWQALVGLIGVEVGKLGNGATTTNTTNNQ